MEDICLGGGGEIRPFVLLLILGMAKMKTWLGAAAAVEVLPAVRK